MSTKILITGATGFIGSHMTELCVENGFNVVAFDRYNPNNDWGWLWTSAETFPYIHSHREQSWLYFLAKDASGKPLFYHYGTEQWLNAKP